MKNVKLVVVRQTGTDKDWWAKHGAYCIGTMNEEQNEVVLADGRKLGTFETAEVMYFGPKRMSIWAEAEGTEQYFALVGDATDAEEIDVKEVKVTLFDDIDYEHKGEYVSEVQKAHLLDGELYIGGTIYAERHEIKVEDEIRGLWVGFDEHSKKKYVVM